MAGAIYSSMWSAIRKWNSNPRISIPNPIVPFSKIHSFSPLSPYISVHSGAINRTHFYLKATSSVGSTEYTEEPATNVKFQTSLCLPGCSSSLSLLGTGSREKVFSVIGVKVYAAGLYVNKSILSALNAWKGQ